MVNIEQLSHFIERDIQSPKLSFFQQREIAKIQFLDIINQERCQESIWEKLIMSIILQECVKNFIKLFTLAQALPHKINLGLIQARLRDGRWSRVKIKFRLFRVSRAFQKFGPLIPKGCFAFDEIRHIGRHCSEDNFGGKLLSHSFQIDAVFFIFLLYTQKQDLLIQKFQFFYNQIIWYITFLLSLPLTKWFILFPNMKVFKQVFFNFCEFLFVFKLLKFDVYFFIDIQQLPSLFRAINLIPQHSNFLIILLKKLLGFFLSKQPSQVRAQTRAHWF